MGVIFESVKIVFGPTWSSSRVVDLSKKLCSYGQKKGAISPYYSENLFAKFLEEQTRLSSTWGSQFEKLPTTLFSEPQKKLLSDSFLDF